MSKKTVEEVLADALDVYVSDTLKEHKAGLVRLLGHVVGDVLDSEDIVGLADEIIELLASEPDDDDEPSSDGEHDAMQHDDCAKCGTSWS